MDWTRGTCDIVSSVRAIDRRAVPPGRGRTEERSHFLDMMAALVGKIVAGAPRGEGGLTARAGLAAALGATRTRGARETLRATAFIVYVCR